MRALCPRCQHTFADLSSARAHLREEHASSMPPVVMAR